MTDKFSNKFLNELPDQFLKKTEIFKKNPKKFQIKNDKECLKGFP